MHLSSTVRPTGVQVGDVILTDGGEYTVVATTRTGKMTLQETHTEREVGVGSFAHDTLDSDVVEVCRK